MERVRHIADALHGALPADYSAALHIVRAIAPRLTHSFQAIAVTEYVARHGLCDFDASMAALAELTRFGSAEFAIRPFLAVDTPRGLLVPTLFAAETKTLGQISAEAKALAKSAIDGSINPDFLQGGTFTISNLGLYGIESFTPVINPPQVALLGVNCITERIRTVDGQITAYPAMGLSLTYDHRAVDGAPASRFLKDLVTALEHFDLLLIG